MNALLSFHLNICEMFGSVFSTIYSQIFGHEDGWQ